MDRAAESAYLRAIRRRVAALDGSSWMMSADGDATLLDARGTDGSLVTIAHFTPLASLDEIELITAAPDDLIFLLRLVDRAIADKLAQLKAQGGSDSSARRAPDHTTEAAMLCGDAAFKRFLMDVHGLESPATDDRTAQRLRGLLGVTSRKEINQSDAARARWIALRDEFRKWKGRAAA